MTAIDDCPRGRPKKISEEDGVEVAREIKGTPLGGRGAKIRTLALRWGCSETTIREVYRRNFPSPVRERNRQAILRAAQWIQRNIGEVDAVQALEGTVLMEHLQTIAAEL